MTRAATFRKADIARAVEAVKAAGCPVEYVEILRDGTIRIITNKRTDLTYTNQGPFTQNPWDRS